MKVLDHLEEWLISTLMGLATIIIFVAVIHRYLSGMPIPGLQDWLLTLNFSWAQEATIYLFVWMAKFGAAYGVRTGIHVGVDLLHQPHEGQDAAPSSFSSACSPARSSPARSPRSAPTSSGPTARTTRSSRARPRHHRHADGPTTPDLEVADLDHLLGDPARLVADVLPLPAGRLALPPHR